MADDFPEYEPHTLTDDRRKACRELVNQTRIDTQWANNLEAALDDADYWRSRASKPTADDSELQGELDVLREASDQRYWHSQHLHLARMCNAAHGHIDAINRGEFAGPTLDVKCQQLADALTAERAKVAELQSELADAKREAEAARLFVETQTAANARRAEEYDGEIDSALKERDDLEETCDALAGAIANHLGIDIGEHSNLNEPWAVALNAIESAGAHRAEESQLEPVGWAWRRSLSGAIEVDEHERELKSGGIGAYYTLDRHVKPNKTYRIYIKPAEPLEVTP